MFANCPVIAGSLEASLFLLGSAAPAKFGMDPRKWVGCSTVDDGRDGRKF